MLINLSNHPSSKWTDNQLQTAAELFGTVVDLPFPAVSPDGDESYIRQLADEYFCKIQSLANGEIYAVHIMGEMNFTFELVNRLKSIGVTCVASTTKRIVHEGEDDVKMVVFNFVRFRKY